MGTGGPPGPLGGYPGPPKARTIRMISSAATTKIKTAYCDTIKTSKK